MTNHFSYFALLADVPVVTLPTCSLTLNPTIIQNGSTTIATWSFTNSLTGILSPGTLTLGSMGSQMITPPSNTTTLYTITTSNLAGTGSCSASVTTTVAPPPPVPSCTLTSTPSNVVNGSGTLLSWKLVNALTGMITPGNILTSQIGSQSVIPPISATTVYTLVVSIS